MYFCLLLLEFSNLIHLTLTQVSAYIHCNYTVKSEMIEDQNHKLEDEKKTLQSQLEKHMQKLQELSGNVTC